MRARLALLLAAGLGALPGSAAAFEAYVAAVMPLQVSPSSLARPVTTMAANIPFNVLGCGRWCQVQYGGTMGYVPAAFVIPGAPPPAPGAIAPPFVLPFAAPGLLSDGYAPRRDYGYGVAPFFGTSPEPYCEEPATRAACVSRPRSSRDARKSAHVRPKDAGDVH